MALSFMEVETWSRYESRAESIFNVINTHWPTNRVETPSFPTVINNMEMYTHDYK